MKITPMEIRSHGLKKAFRGYDLNEVNMLKDLAADALEDATRELSLMEEKHRGALARLSDFENKENVLRDTITTAQKMVEDLKANARKEAELILAEARVQADEIIRLSQSRARELQEEIYRLRKQRIELETQIKSIIDYHSNTLVLEETESQRADEESDKLRFLPK